MGAHKGQKRKAYTAQEIEFISINAESMFYSQIGKILGRSKASVKNVVRQLGISTPSIRARSGNRKPKEKPANLPTSKVCTGCKKDLQLSEFTKAKLGKFGLRSKCKTCRAAEAVIRGVEQKEEISSYGKRYRKEKAEQISKQRAEHAVANKEQLKEYAKEYRKNNPGKVNAKTAKRRAALLQRTPPGLTVEHWKQIESFYVEAARLTKETGIPHEVDHIEPLQGKEVSGLHVPWNLRVIPKSTNRRKSFKRIA